MPREGYKKKIAYFDTVLRLKVLPFQHSSLTIYHCYTFLLQTTLETLIRYLVKWKTKIELIIIKIVFHTCTCIQFLTSKVSSFVPNSQDTLRLFFKFLISENWSKVTMWLAQRHRQNAYQNLKAHRIRMLDYTLPLKWHQLG